MRAICQNGKIYQTFQNCRLDKNRKNSLIEKIVKPVKFLKANETVKTARAVNII